MPCFWSSAPRKKLPPPTTIATCTPLRTTSAISAAILLTTSGSTPTLPPPKTSPDSLSSTLVKPVILISSLRVLGVADEAGGPAGGVAAPPPTGLLIAQTSCPTLMGSGADLEAGEPGHAHAGRVEDRLDRLLVLGHRRLVEQRDVLEEAVKPTLDDLGQRTLRLALLACGGLGDLALLGDDVGG